MISNLNLKKPLKFNYSTQKDLLVKKFFNVSPMGFYGTLLPINFLERRQC